MLAALAIFFASSAVCATAKTMQELIIGRAFQGTAGGGLILLVHVCISDLFSLRQRSLLMVSCLACCVVGVAWLIVACRASPRASGRWQVASVRSWAVSLLVWSLGDGAVSYISLTSFPRLSHVFPASFSTDMR